MSLQLSIFCPELCWLRGVWVENDVTSVDLKKVVSARMSTDSIDLYLVPHGLIKLPDKADPTPVWSALCEHAPSDVRQLTRHNLKSWLDTLNPDKDELHLVVRFWCYPAINVFDMGTRKLRMVEDIHIHNMVDGLLAKGTEDYSVYQIPQGIKDPTMLSEDGVNSLNIATFQKVTKGTVLSTLSPWGYMSGELHFVLVPPDKSGQEEDEEDTLANPTKVVRVTGKRARSPSSSAPRKHARAYLDALQDIYKKAWGHKWPSEDRTILRAELGLGPDELASPGEVEPLDGVPIGDGANLSDEWKYTCLLDIEPLMEALGALVTSSHSHRTTTFVVRDDYATLVKTLEEGNYSMVVTGQPGIGKSTFLIYLLLHRLQHCLPTAIQFTQDVFIMFDANGATPHNAATILPPSPCLTKDCWALSDSNSDAVRPCRAFTASKAYIIQATSPEPIRWKQWQKQNDAHIVIAELPTLFEIAAIARDLGLNPAKAVAVARKWGACTRTVLSILRSRDDSSHESKVEHAVKLLCEHPSTISSSNSPMKVDSSVSDVVFVRRRPGENLGLVRASIPTPHILAIFDSWRAKMSASKLMELYETLSLHPTMRSGAGWLFERRMHIYMGSGTSLLQLFRADKVTTMQRVTIPLPGSMAALKAHPSKSAFYWYPDGRNFPGIDGVLVNAREPNDRNLYCLQATIADKHRTLEDGLRKLRDTMGATASAVYQWHVVVVTDTAELAKKHADAFHRKLCDFSLGRGPMKVQAVQVWGCVLPDDA